MTMYSQKRFWHLKGSLNQVLRYFARNEEVCWAAAVVLRWPLGKVYCSACLKARVFPTSTGWKCKDCGRHFSVVAGTALHNAKVPLSKWLSAAWLIVDDETITTAALSRLLDIMPKSAQRMGDLIRSAMPGECDLDIWPPFVASESMAELQSRFLRFSGRLHKCAGAHVSRIFLKVMGRLLESAVVAETQPAANNDEAVSDSHSQNQSLAAQDGNDNATGRRHKVGLPLVRRALSMNPELADYVKDLGKKWCSDPSSAAQRIIASASDVKDVIAFRNDIWSRIIFPNSKRRVVRYSLSQNEDLALLQLAIQVLGSRNKSEMFRLLVVYVGKNEKVLQIVGGLSTVRLKK